MSWNNPAKIVVEIDTEKTEKTESRHNKQIKQHLKEIYVLNTGNHLPTQGMMMGRALAEKETAEHDRDDERFYIK